MTNRTSSSAISSAYRKLCVKVIVTAEKDLRRLYKKQACAVSHNEALSREIQSIESFKKKRVI